MNKIPTKLVMEIILNNGGELVFDNYKYQIQNNIWLISHKNGFIIDEFHVSSIIEFWPITNDESNLDTELKALHNYLITNYPEKYILEML